MPFSRGNNRNSTAAWAHSSQLNLRNLSLDELCRSIDSVSLPRAPMTSEQKLRRRLQANEDKISKIWSTIGASDQD